MSDPSDDDVLAAGSLVSFDLTEDAEGSPLGVEQTVWGRVTLRRSDIATVEYEAAPDATYPPLPEED